MEKSCASSWASCVNHASKLNQSTTSWRQLLHRSLKRFRGGLVLKAHRRLYHSTLCLRVIKSKTYHAGKRPAATRFNRSVFPEHKNDRHANLSLPHTSTHSLSLFVSLSISPGRFCLFRRTPIIKRPPSAAPLPPPRPTPQRSLPHSIQDSKQAR